MQLNLELDNELGLVLLALRQEGESPESTATRIILQAYQDHKSERAPDATADAPAEG